MQHTTQINMHTKYPHTLIEDALIKEYYETRHLYLHACLYGWACKWKAVMKGEEDDKKGEEVCVTEQKWASTWRGRGPTEGRGRMGKAVVENQRSIKPVAH